MAALIGTWSAAEGTGSITLAARTTTSGSLITAAAGGWKSSGTDGLPLCTDAHSNTYVEPAGDLDCDSGTPNARITLQYNAGAGTRGSGHTISNAFTNFASNSLGAHEWSGVQTSPTVVSNTATGSSTTPSASVSVGAVSLVVAAVGIATDTTITASGGASLAQDVDTNNSNQEHTTLYKIGQTGSPSVGADLGASTGWGVIIIAFTEIVGSVALTGTVTESVNEADIVTGGKTIILTVTDDAVVPASEISDISFIANALGATNSTTSFSITLPTTQSGDILILEFAHRGTGDGTIGGTSITTGGLTWTLKHSQLFGSSAFSGKTYWTRATGDHAGQTVTGSGLTNSCAAIVTQYRGALASGDPLTAATIVGEENASGNETQAEITTTIDKAMVVLVVVNSPDLAVATQACTSPGTLTERAERLSTGGTDSSIAHASEVKAAAGATGALTWTQTNAASGSWAYAIAPNTTTPFADARAAIRDGVDSAQAEAAGWDVKVKPNIPLGNIVRTSDTVITITLQAQVDYDITAQETITATVPASALTGGSAIAATPTFTIAVVEDGIEEADGAGTGTGTPTGVGAALFIGLGSAVGAASDSATSGATQGSVGSADGVTAPLAVGASHYLADVVSTGSTTSSAVGASYNLTTGSIDGLSTPTSVGAAIFAIAAASSGVAAVAADGEAVTSGTVIDADASSAGLGTPTSVAAAVWTLVADSSGTTTPLAEAIWFHSVPGLAVGTATDSFVTGTHSGSVSSAEGLGMALGELAYFLEADFLSESGGGGSPGGFPLVIND